MLFRTRNRSGSSLAEFGPVMGIFFIFFLFPLLDLISFGTGVGTVMFMANMAARQAATASTFGDAQQSALTTEQQLVNFMRFAKMSPSNGAQSGLKLIVMVSPLAGQGQSSTYNTWQGAPVYAQATGPIPNAQPTADQADPDDKANPQPNTGNTVYQYIVTANYDVQPLFNFNGFGLFKNVPALGQPVPVTFNATATVEHPDGLNSGPTK